MQRLSLTAAILSLLCSPAFARTINVRPGQSIRAAVARAQPGDRIQVFPGTYREGSPDDAIAVNIATAGLELVGLSSPGQPVVLENAGSQGFGIWVSPADSSTPEALADDEHPPCGLNGGSLSGFALRGFTVRGFAVHGVHLACVNGFAIDGNVADGNLVYGLFPIVSQNGTMTGNEVMNTTNDAGIYVGQSDAVLIAGNRVHDSLLGIEVENSRRCAVVGNEVHDSTFGIFVDILPFLERETQEDTFIAFNNVHDNARPNTAEPDDLLGALPPGIGVLIVGAQRTAISTNQVVRNAFAGVAVVNLCLGFELLGGSCDGIDVNPLSNDTRVTGNTVLGNGTQPTGTQLDALLGDLVWDGTGSGNCWSNNTFGTSVPSPLPACN